ncbi:MAG: hypothetical protein M3O31_09930 [Acidobacteriota bacterium]|nr:hypothetical protein [Acidobacteriota bacterium]
MALTPITAKAATDITGAWTGQMKAPDGSNSFELRFVFKVEGAKLTGTVLGPQGDPIAISDGKIDGNKISFTVVVADMGMTVTHEGTVSDAGDEIKLTTKSEQGPAGEVTLKRPK